MSARVIRLPGAMTPAAREAKRQRLDDAGHKRRMRMLLEAYAMLKASNEAAERGEAERVAKMVVPFGERRRRPAAKPRHPTGPGAAA